LTTARKRKATRQKSPGQQAIKWSREDDDDDDDDDTDAGSHVSEKRQRVSQKPALKRKLKSAEAFSHDDHRVLNMIHAADLLFPIKKSKLAVEEKEDRIIVELQYPSNSQRER
jgi:hypothetical protein